MKRVVIFDFGGVLMKTVDYSPRLSWDERLNLEPGTVERTVHNTTSWVKAQTGQIAIDVYWQDVAQQLGISESEVQQLALDFYSGDRLDIEHINYIHQLKDNGHRVALLSNDSIELLPKLKSLNIDNLFDPLVVSAHIGVMKPDPAAYQTVLDALQLPAEATIFVDDREENITAARKLGIHGVLYKDGTDLPQTLSTLLES